MHRWFVPTKSFAHRFGFSRTGIAVSLLMTTSGTVRSGSLGRLTAQCHGISSPVAVSLRAGRRQHRPWS